VGDLTSWGAIGARTTESQVHRELTSGISAPVGFKNATDGKVQVAIDAMHAARSGHHFLSVTKNGNAAIFETEGNDDTHLILRGGKASGPNYDEGSIHEAFKQQKEAGMPTKLMVDCSHGNSQKDHNNQPGIVRYLADLYEKGNEKFFGLMIESHLKAGKQKLSDNMVYGQSITDACIGWEDTVDVLNYLAEAVKKRRT
jgi:3-deoxy-7-phosphoheptulonate synthase